MENQKIKLVIDLGSTNSVIAWQKMVQVEKGVWVPDPEDAQSSFTIPSVYIKEVGKYGEYAEDYLLEKSREKTQAVYDFKAKLYSSNPEISAEGERCMIEFLSYLRTRFEKNNNYSDQFVNSVGVQVLLTVPVTASGSMRTRMKKIAEEAGFTVKKGHDQKIRYDQIQIIDEGRSLVDYACMDPSSPLAQEIAKLQSDPNASKMALFVDIGGLTADINLAQIRYDAQDGYAIDIISSWPDPEKRFSQKELCGGAVLDQALCEYLVSEGFIDREAADREVSEHGYLRFRKLKEDFNKDFWACDDPGIPDTLYGLEKKIGSKSQRKYNRCAEEDQLSAGKFVRLVANDYIKMLKEAIRSVMNEGQDYPGTDTTQVNLCNVDWVFLTGGGSQMFFVQDLFLGGPIGDAGESLDFQKIREQPVRLLCGSADTPTESCALGALRFTGRARISAHHQHDLKAAISAVNGSGERVELDMRTFLLTGKHDAYPIHKEEKYDFYFRWSKAYQHLEITSKILTDGQIEEYPVGSSVTISIQKPQQEKGKVGKGASGAAVTTFLAFTFWPLAVATAVGTIVELIPGTYRADVTCLIDIDADGSLEISYNVNCAAAEGKGKVTGDL